MKKIIITALILCCFGSVFAKKVATFPDLLRPGGFLLSDGYLYIRDGITIYIYSAQDFTLIKKFGKEGEGPGEFKRAIYWWGIRGDSLVVQSYQRVSYFSRQGNYIKEMTMRPLCVFYIPVEKHFVGLRNFFEKGVIYYKFRLFAADQEQIKVVLSYKNHYQRNKTINPILDLDWPYFDTYAGKIFIENQALNSIVDVFDVNGDKLFSLGQGLEKVKVTAEDEKKYIEYYKTTPGFKSYYEEHKRFYRFPKYFPLIRSFRFDDNKVYAITYKKTDNYSQFFIYDMKGQRLGEKKVPLRYRDDLNYFPFIIKDGRLYQMVENRETDTWELHVLDLSSNSF